MKSDIQNVIINTCKGIINSLDPSLSLLVLYEFEAQLTLGLPEANNVLDILSSSEPKIYETQYSRFCVDFSALAMHTPPRDNGVILVKAALKITINDAKSRSDLINTLSFFLSNF